MVDPRDLYSEYVLDKAQEIFVVLLDFSTSLNNDILKGNKLDRDGVNEFLIYCTAVFFNDIPEDSCDLIDSIELKECVLRLIAAFIKKEKGWDNISIPDYMRIKIKIREYDELYVALDRSLDMFRAGNLYSKLYSVPKSNTNEGGLNGFQVLIFVGQIAEVNKIINSMMIKYFDGYFDNILYKIKNEKAL